VALHAEVEATETVARQAVAAALQNNGLGLVVGHDGVDDGLEDVLVGLIGNAIAQGKVDGIMLALADANVAELTGSREILAIFVERDGHDAVGRVEGLFDAVAVVHINVNVENALVEAEQLDDAENDVWKVSRSRTEG
jgi:hypothetical protein